MNTKIYLQRGFFAENAKTIMENDEFKVNLFKYSSGRSDRSNKFSW